MVNTLKQDLYLRVWKQEDSPVMGYGQVTCDVLLRPQDWDGDNGCGFEFPSDYTIDLSETGGLYLYGFRITCQYNTEHCYSDNEHRVPYAFSFEFDAVPFGFKWNGSSKMDAAYRTIKTIERRYRKLMEKAMGYSNWEPKAYEDFVLMVAKAMKVKGFIINWKSERCATRDMFLTVVTDWDFARRHIRNLYASR